MEDTIKAPTHFPLLSTEPREVQFDYSTIPDIRLINMHEEFKFIDDYTVPNIIPERYMISNYGRVYDRLYSQFVDFIPDQNGYPAFVVNYYMDWNTIGYIAIRVCDAVMRTFCIIPQYENTEIRHIDGNKNHYGKNNLEWFDPDGLPNHLVEVICARLQSGSLIKSLVEMFDIPRYVIEDIRDGKRYVHIRRKYKIHKKRMNILLPGQVREICLILEKNPSIDSSEIANRLNCTVGAVEGVRSGRSYTKITKDFNFVRQKTKEEKAKTLDNDTIRDICETFVRQPELNNYQIAIMFKCKPTQIRDLRLRKVHKDIVKDYNW